MTNKFDHFIRKYHNGDEEEAFFGLVDLGLDVLPDLLARFHAEVDFRERAFLLKISRNIGEPTSVSLMGEALHDQNPDVWKEALDGLVTLASPQALNVLYSARSNRLDNDDVFQEWLDEAIEQIEATQRNHRQALQTLKTDN